eukprot:1043369-Rhodomonas_salina.1
MPFKHSQIPRIQHFCDSHDSCNCNTGGHLGRVVARSPMHIDLALHDSWTVKSHPHDHGEHRRNSTQGRDKAVKC